MVIAFWSPKAGVSGTTVNLLLMAHMLTDRGLGRNLIIAPQYSEVSPEKMISGSLVADEEMLFEDRGIDSLVMNLKSKPLSEELLRDCTTELVENRLEILRSTENPNPYYYGTDGNSTLAYLTEMARRFYDVVFVDTAAGNGALTMNILNRADVVIVNLRQSPELIEKVMNGALFSEKCFYLFGQYSEESRYNINNLRRRYRKLTKQNSAKIPFDAGLCDAIEEGRLYEYLSVMESAGRGNRRFEVYEQILDASETLLSWIKSISLPGGAA